MERKFNFRTYHKEYATYFKDTTQEQPELRTIDEIENDEVWKTLTIREKTWLFATLLDWLEDRKVRSKTSIDEFREVFEYLSKQEENQNKRIENVFQIGDKLDTIPTKQAKLNYLNSELLAIEMFKGQYPDQDKENQDIREYLTATIAYWEKHNDEFPPWDRVTGKSYITHPRQVLLFHELGIIKFLTDKYKLGKEQTSEIISLLANRGKDNTGDYIRYIEQPKGKTAKSKQNMNPKTPDNLEFIKQIIKKITPPV